MKRAFEKTICIASIILALIFVAIVLLTVFQVINAADFENGVLKGILVVLALLYAIAALISAFFVFSTGDELKEVIVFNRQESSTKVTKGVIVKLAKQSLKGEDGVKVRGVKVLLTDRGLNLRIVIKTDSVDIPETTEYIKGILDDVFARVLLIKFKNIDFKIISVKSNYEAPRADIRGKAVVNVDRTPHQASAVSADDTADKTEKVTMSDKSNFDGIVAEVKEKDVEEKDVKEEKEKEE